MNLVLPRAQTNGLRVNSPGEDKILKVIKVKFLLMNLVLPRAHYNGLRANNPGEDKIAAFVLQISLNKGTVDGHLRVDKVNTFEPLLFAGPQDWGGVL